MKSYCDKFMEMEIMLEESKKISDYLDIGFLQMLQDNCSKAMGLAFVTVDYRGCPITNYSGFTPYCRLGRENQGFFEMCKQCDAHGGFQAAITGEPHIYRCHAGLVDFALPLIRDGIYMGSLMGGQIRLDQEEKGELECILPVQLIGARTRFWMRLIMKHRWFLMIKSNQQLPCCMI